VLSIPLVHYTNFISNPPKTWAAGSLPLMYAGRFVGGLGLGGSSLLVPLYLSEISPPAIRGFIVGMHEMGNQLASIAGFWVNYGVLPISGSKQWMVSLAIQMIPGGLLFAACFVIPESPRWLVKKGRIEKAAMILARIRNLPIENAYLQDELRAMETQAVVERNEALAKTGEKGWLNKIFGKGDLRRLGLGCALMAAQQLTGINAMNYYSVRYILIFFLSC
jgi:MFS family permease